MVVAQLHVVVEANQVDHLAQHVQDQENEVIEAVLSVRVLIMLDRPLNVAVVQKISLQMSQ